MPYIGTSPSNSVRRVHTYTATASQTTFTGASSEGVTLSYADTNYIDVFQNGVLLGSDDYTATSGTSVVLSQSASSSDLIVIICYDVFSVADTVSKTNGGSFDSAVTISGDLTIPDKIIHDGDTNTAIRFPSADTVTFETGGSERARVDSSGNFHVAVTSTNQANVGISLNANGNITSARDGGIVGLFNRLSSDGEIISFRKDGSTVGKIGSVSGRIFIGSDSVAETFIGFNNNYVYPADDDGAFNDNAIDLGNASARYDDVFATNGTINTSDINEKQDIEELTDAEKKVAVVAKGLMRKFRWKDKVVEKGDNARTHFGIIAQDLEDAFKAEGLDASKYAMFCSNTWTDDDGKEQTRLGVRYSELLAFIISAI